MGLYLHYFLFINVFGSSCSHAGPERPGAVWPDRALCLPTFSHFLIVNKTSLSTAPLSPTFVCVCDTVCACKARRDILHQESSNIAARVYFFASQTLCTRECGVICVYLHVPVYTYLHTSSLSLSLSLPLSLSFSLGPVRPEGVLPDRALYLPTSSHFVSVNKASLSLPPSLSLSLSLSIRLSLSLSLIGSVLMSECVCARVHNKN